MSCPDIVDLEHYLLRNLDESAIAAVAQHLKSCSDCSTAVSELQDNLELAAALKRAAKPEAALQEAHPQQVGPYRILRKLGEGGMGSVFEAQQENPHRVVALKIVRSSLVSPRLLARFRREAQVLGRLRHPGIAQIYEAGTEQSSDGARRPYFVMELVRGPSLLSYAESKNSTVRQRLELLAKVCDAVQHAHQRGVIHRDLKPDNILVDESAEAPQPKILDFGVARVIDPDGHSTTVHTSAGQIVGTVAYMSPEQASADVAEIDTRSDVYALGVICYQLLCGKLPYKLNMTSVAESVRAIVQDEPTPLSTVDRTLRGDVTTIVGKALEKERTRRYPSAAEMAADIRRFLRDEPISAHPPSTIYQVRKFARRNKGLVAGIAAAFVFLIAGFAATTWGMIRAQHARQIADLNFRKAQLEAQKQSAVNNFMRDLLLSANPRNLSAEVKGRGVTVLEALNAAAKKVDAGSLKDTPDVELAVRLSISVVYSELGELSLAEHHLAAAEQLAQRVTGANGSEMADVLNSLALIKLQQGRLPDAEALSRRAVAACQVSNGPRSAETAACINTLALILEEAAKYSEAERNARQSLDIRRAVHGSDAPETATALNTLARIYGDEGKPDEAEPLYRESLAIRTKRLGDEHPDVASTLNNLGFILREQGKYEEAEQFFRRSLDIRVKAFGEEHPSVALANNSLASLLHQMGRKSDAEPLYRKALELQRRLSGEDSTAFAISLNNLGTLLRDENKLDEAEELFRKSLALRKKNLGADHPSVALAMRNLANIMVARGQVAEAEQLARGAVTIAVAKLGPQHPDSATYRVELGNCLIELRQYPAAEKELLDAVSVLQPKLGPKHPQTISAAKYLTRLYERWDKPQEAQKYRVMLAATQPATQPRLAGAVR